MRWAALVQRVRARREQDTKRARLVAPGVVALYWGALIAGFAAHDAAWNLHALWVYPLAGAAAVVYVGSPGRWALRSIVLGALLPPVGITLLLMLSVRNDHGNIADSNEIGPVIALGWLAVSVAQVLVAAFLIPLLHWIAARTGLIPRREARAVVTRH